MKNKELANKALETSLINQPIDEIATEEIFNAQRSRRHLHMGQYKPGTEIIYIDFKNDSELRAK